ncbi:MAG: glycosyltransferase family 4 protein [Planctomycetota bacterium]
MTAPATARPRVYLCRGDDAGWAVDEDLRLTRAALADTVELVQRPEQAQVIHAVWWEPLLQLDAALLHGRRVICHMTGEPVRCWGEPRFLRATARTHLWIAQSRAAAEQLREVGAHHAHVPYAVDVQAFADAPAQGPLVELLREPLAALGRDAYLIANFHRDTAGAGLDRGELVPKLVKGPDLFLEILAELRRRGHNAAALLAGPRRHWLRRELTRRGVPFVHVGDDGSDLERGDDYPRAILPKDQVGTLLKLADLCLITSRSEGGPRAVLEAAAAGCPTLSTPVGHAPDLLPPECLYRDPLDAVARIERDVARGDLRHTVPLVQAALLLRHTPAAVAARWREVYAELVQPELPAVVHDRPALPAASTPTTPAQPRQRVLSLWNKFTPPPWGGGNQFLLALQAEAERVGVRCVQNEAGPHVGAHVVNSVQFDMERFEAQVRPRTARVIHRIDGPISVLRGTAQSLGDDRRCFEFNRRHATATVIQSVYTRTALRALGLEPVRPVLIPNGADPQLFHRPPSPPKAAPRLRVCATSWSPNPGKGAAIYQWLDRELDHDRVEFTFVGNLEAELANARVLPPLPSAELGAFLRTQDVYLTASRNDPCSNALVEALSCGLPALYLRSGGHPELVGFGGLPFDRPDEIPGLLERLRTHREMYAALLQPPELEDVCRRYLALAFDDEPFAP